MESRKGGGERGEERRWGKKKRRLEYRSKERKVLKYKSVEVMEKGRDKS